MCVGMSASNDAAIKARRKAFTFGRITQQRTRASSRFLGIAEVNDRLAFRPENLSMLVGILRQHTATGRRNFEAPHYMAVSIRSANQAKVHFRRGRQGANSLWWLYPQSGCPKCRVSFPIAAR